MSNIFQISQDYIQLANVLEDNGGEITPEIESQLAITNEQLQTKGVNYALVIRQLDGESSIIEAEIKRLQAIKKAKDSSVTRLKNTLRSAMELFGIESIKGDLISISLRKGSKSVLIDDDAAIPEKYEVKQDRKFDKTKLSNDLKCGLSIPGASLKEGDKSIIIK